MARIIIGRNNSTAKNQFKLNPNLQRTQATGNRQGFTLGTMIPKFPVIAKGLVRLQNRNVPLNADAKNIKKVPRFDVPSLLGVTTRNRRGKQK